MFLIHGRNIILYYESPMALGPVAFIPNLITSSTFIVSQLQYISSSWLFSKPPSQLNFVKWNYLCINQFTRGLCFCCYAKQTWLNNWSDYPKAKRILNNLGNYSHCIQKYWLWGNINKTSQGHNIVPDMYPDNFPLFEAKDSFNVGSICAGWQLKDPTMWFFFDKYATNVHPQNYQCAAIGYLSLPVQIGVPGQLSSRRKRAALGPACSDEVIMDTQLSALSTYGRAIAGAITGVITFGSYPGIIAQENRHSILGLTCRLEKSINATVAIIRDLQNEIEELNQDMLQQRFAIDYLLARQGGFCTLVGQLACAVHFHSLNKTIEDELANLQASIKDNVHEKIFSF
ncbi:uncharacterized protein LOC131198883 [Ahaetulla prasina]|uniref:uncharacterized protein LOC131198883 n=1 Tax=Ahaetulla prasina TaxID=499056 RepID=UPI0026494AB2|nr:uncharacterized protein LOC131198883 [Ahaetulla prasina]XP_058040052.1 uncharacterized protein LOC131198883 [Ahaetulla prasina]